MLFCVICSVYAHTYLRFVNILLRKIQHFLLIANITLKFAKFRCQNCNRKRYPKYQYIYSLLTQNKVLYRKHSKSSSETKPPVKCKCQCDSGDSCYGKTDEELHCCELKERICIVLSKGLHLFCKKRKRKSVNQKKIQVSRYENNCWDVLDPRNIRLTTSNLLCSLSIRKDFPLPHLA